MTIDKAELDRRFKYHAPDAVTGGLHERWREHTRWLAERIAGLEGESREKSLALTSLEECSFWVHAHIARNITLDP